MKVYVTFGQRFRREAHPILPNAHPDGWYELDLPDEDVHGMADVNLIVYGLLDGNWSNAYVGDDFDPSFHPLGKLGDLDYAGRTLIDTSST